MEDLRTSPSTPGYQGTTAHVNSQGQSYYSKQHNKSHPINPIANLNQCQNYFHFRLLNYSPKSL